LSTLEATEGVRHIGTFSDGEAAATVYELR
jgi:hypothetical protein